MMNSRKQQFDTFHIWVAYNRPWLSEHPNWGENFRAYCYDTLGRHCTEVTDFHRAREDKTFPVKWLWPDEIGQLALDMTQQSEANLALYVKYLGMATLLSDAMVHVHVWDDGTLHTAARAAFMDLAETCPDIEVSMAKGRYTVKARGKDEQA